MKKNSRYLFMYNIRNILKNSIVMIMLAIGFALLACVYYRGKFTQGFTGSLFSLDYLLYLFKGADIVNVGQASAKMDIPIMYLGMALAFSYITGRNIYSENDHIIFTYSKSRPGWYTGKVAGLFVVVLAVISLITLTGCIFGGFNMNYYSNESTYLVQYDYNKMTGAGEMFLYIAVIYLTYMAVIMLQVTVSLIFNSVTGFLVAMAVCIMSIFINNPVLFGNGAMLIRYNIFTINGENVITALVINVAVIVISYVVGYIVIIHKDILSKNQ
ncbi:MAG: hypothetical protein ACI4E1_10755 [Lachnospira sp.]